MELFYETLIENDLNPFMLFNDEGKLLKYNKEAEYLLSFVSSREIYDLAVSSAPLSFGFQRSFVTLHYERNSFYAILVGYLDESSLGIKLYKEVTDSHKLEYKSAMTEINIFTLLKLSRNSTLSHSQVILNEIYDPSIPDVKLNVEKFLLLLNKLFTMYHDSKELFIKVFLKIGETIVFNGKKYPICSIKFHSYDTQVKDAELFYQLAKEADVSLFVKSDFVMIEFPLISA